MTLGEVPAYGGLFTPPVSLEVPAVLPTTTGAQRRLFRYYGPNPRGLSVVFEDGHFVTVRNPTEDQLIGDEGIRWFLGGHRYVVDDDLAELLVADGFADYLTPISTPTTHTWSIASTFTWGEIAGYSWGATP